MRVAMIDQDIIGTCALALYNPAMFARVLSRMRQLVHRGLFMMTTHADEEADADDLSVFDVESAILTGEITHRQRDEQSGEWKYIARGQTLDERLISVVAKFGASARKLYIMTVYA